MESNLEIVDRIVDAIKHIRGKRNRAGFETLLAFINRNGSKCDIDDMKEAIQIAGKRQLNYK